MEWVFFSVFLVDTLLKTYLAESRMLYIMSFDGVAAVASVLPVLQINGQVRRRTQRSGRGVRKDAARFRCSSP